jgi:transcriptional regulator with XRE-family HTH domain
MMSDSESELYKYVGAQLRARRQTLDLTQAQIGEQVGVLRSTIANIEAGRQRITLFVLYQICAVLELEVSMVLPMISTPNGTATVKMPINGMLQEVSPKTAEALKKLLNTDL